MADYVVKGESLTAVADAIREKTGETDALGLDEMPGKVGDVFEAGKKSEYDAFWDLYQENGNRTNYTCAFSGPAWNDETYNPKYPITATGSSTYFFMQSGVTDTKVPIDIGTTSGSGSSRFMNAANLVTIRKLIVEEKATYSSCFSGCKNLENLTIEGVIGKDISVSVCTKLTHASLMSIINALKDYAGSGTTYTCTLGTANLAKLTDAEKQIATQKGWTLA